MPFLYQEVRVQGKGARSRNGPEGLCIWASPQSYCSPAYSSSSARRCSGFHRTPPQGVEAAVAQSPRESGSPTRFSSDARTNFRNLPAPLLDGAERSRKHSLRTSAREHPFLDNARAGRKHVLRNPGSVRCRCHSHADRPVIRIFHWPIEYVAGVFLVLVCNLCLCCFGGPRVCVFQPNGTRLSSESRPAKGNRFRHSIRLPMGGQFVPSPPPTERRGIAEQLFGLGYRGLAEGKPARERTC